jgi:hypothetical protein
MAIYVGDKRYAPYIGDKRRRYMGGGGGILPSGYTQILGVKNTSTAYLPIAVKLGSGVRYELEISATSISSYTGIFSRNSVRNKEIIIFFHAGRQCYFNGGFNLSEGLVSGKKYKIVIDLAMESQYARMYIDDVKVRETSVNVDEGEDMYIFHDSVESRNGWVKGVLNTFKAYSNGELVNDYIPAIRKFDNKVGVYDIASDEFVLSPNGVDFIEP